MPDTPESPNVPALFGSLITPEQALEGQEEQLEFERALVRSEQRLNSIFPAPVLTLTPEEQRSVTQQRLASILMDSAGAAPLRCENLCPFRAQCSLFLMNPPRHPVGQSCPFEVDYLKERFLGWMREIGRDLDTLLESERVAVGNLCSLQLELQRVRKVLARAQNAEMNQLSVRDINAETGEPICWENIIHTAAQREDQILTQIRMTMKDFELTPETKTKKAKALGIRDGNDQASKQSKLYDKIRKRNAQPTVIDAEAQPVDPGE